MSVRMKKYQKVATRPKSGSIFDQMSQSRTLSHNDRAFSFRADQMLAATEEPGVFSKLPRITMVHKRNDCLNNATLPQLLEFLEQRNASEHKKLMWVDIQGEWDLTGIARLLNLHPHTVEDCTGDDSREKLEMRFQHYVYLVVTDVSLPGDKGVNLNMIILPDLLITLHTKPICSIYDVVTRLEYCEDTEIPSIEFVLYVILSSVVTFYEAQIDQLRQHTDVLDERVLTASKVDKQDTPNLLGRLGTTMKRSYALQSSMSVKKDLLDSLCRQRDGVFTQKGAQYLQGTLNQVVKMNLQVSVLHDTLSDIHELYMAKISVQLAVVSNQVSVVTRYFAIINAVMMPAGLIAGLLGMNVPYPSLADGSGLGVFFSVIFTMVGVGIVQLFIFRVLKWM